MLSLNYILKNAGWAVFEISNGQETLSFDISYLHDSLKNLAESAIDLKTKSEKSVVFMDEPGEHWLVLKRGDNYTFNYELRWYEDWANWNLINIEKYAIVLKGVTTLPKYINEIRKILIQIFEEFGPEQYKQMWVEHDFPIEEYEKLK